MFFRVKRVLGSLEVVRRVDVREKLLRITESRDLIERQEDPPGQHVHQCAEAKHPTRDLTLNDGCGRRWIVRAERLGASRAFGQDRHRVCFTDLPQLSQQLG